MTGLSLVRAAPWHLTFYLLQRVGAGVADTAVATLVAKFSEGSDDRANNLALIQSTRAATRIFSPLISGALFARSCRAMGGEGSSWLERVVPPGALPYLVCSTLAFSLTPLPLVLKKIVAKKMEASKKNAGDATS
uniref:Uncharacterized protein n=1 Tax=Corethron hystrix TaxID=216773 RepID=A0A7S1BE18_9STRA|mmetsp:Transcript_24038/g.54668  ORF Transcript_24038/g.54668 Transcript_24038/m.54668 type:complete len:135 (+) Transcript_24038:479-883(+)